MRTFEELAQAALSQEPTHMVVQELAQAMVRLEYNLAYHLSHKSINPYIEDHVADIVTQAWLNNLRADLPTSGFKCPRCGNSAETPQEALMHCGD